MLLLLPLLWGTAQALMFPSGWQEVPRNERAWDAVGMLVASWGDATEANLLEEADEGSCSGTIVVQSRARINPQTRARVLTNGHCAEPGTLLRPGEVWQDVARADYFFLAGPGLNRRYAPLRVRRVVYATMGAADVGVLELEVTYGELAALGIEPLELGEAEVGKRALLVGVPTEGIPVRDRRLHRSQCRLEAPTVSGQAASFFLNGREVIDHYEWPNSYLHRCSMVGGQSGAPLLQDGRVVAVNQSEVAPACAPRCWAQGVADQARRNVAQSLDSVRSLF